MHWKYILLFFATLLVASEVHAQARATFGESCNRSNRCDSRASLTCNNGTCECIMSDVMTFDGSKCAVFAGEKCTFTAVDVQSRGEERSWREELPCVKNSWCQEGFCSCLPEFYESTNGTCIRKRGFQEDCEFILACKTEQFLSCNEDKKCGCNSTTSTYDISRQLCVTKAGQSCVNGEQCVPNAKCRTSTCDCNTGYFANAKGECEKTRGYNEPCENNSNCQFGTGSQDLQLICNPDGHCGCNTTISTFEPSKGICVRLAGADCTGFPHCVKNSVCSGNECRCLSEFFQTSTGTCEVKRGHGKPCQSSDNCQRDLKCGFTGLCECDQSQKVYDSGRGKCVGLVGTSCSYEYDCISNAECNRYNRQCDCRSGYSKSKNGSCLVSHGHSCGLSWTQACNDEQGTVCKQGICSCKYGKIQNYNSGKCESRVLGPCDDGIPCIENSHCSEQDETFRQCVCDNGYVSVGGKCLLGFGQPCSYSFQSDTKDNSRYTSNMCDKAAPLKCIEGICQCDYLEEYDYEAKKCKGLVGATCPDSGYRGYCTPNAICEARRGLPSEQLCTCKSGWLTTRAKRCILEITMRDDSHEIIEVQAEVSSDNTIRIPN